MFSCEFCKNFKNTFFLRAPSGGYFCATLPNMNNSKGFLIDFTIGSRIIVITVRVTLSIQVIYHTSYFLK